VCDINFELARHEFQRTFGVLSDLRVADLVLGLLWLDDEHAFLQYGTTRVFTLMEGTAVETQIEERRPECLEQPALVEHPGEFHTGEELHCRTT
jgi:hypothetical protein